MSQYEYEYETGYEYGPAYETQYGETQYGETGYGGVGELYETYETTASPLHEVQEMELASELLEITNEEELEEFLGNIFKTVARAAGGIIKSPIGQVLMPMLKDVAKQALPMVGGALGTFIAPGLGTALGSKLGSMASGLFEMEFEAMDHEQAEFEAARRYVQLAASTAQNAATTPPNVPPQVAAQQAIAAAAQQYAPGLLQLLGTRTNGGSPGGYAPGGYGPGYYGQGGQPQWASTRPQGGRWARHGRKIVIYGA
jgi:uncharacterized protein (DUF697 family)